MPNLLAPLLLGALCAAHDPQDSFPVNPELGVPGFPDCVRRTPAAALSIDGASHDLVCKQRRAASADTVRIACVGDSITAGVCSTGGNATYPAQLQLMLDAAHGPGAYSVTNLGACGSTMLKGGDSPYWERPQFDAFVNATWDVVIVMLGTNDAKDPGDGGPDNWQHDCGGASHTTLDGCQYASDYADMIALARTLGRDAQTPPRVFANAPPPLMMSGAIGANQTVINSVYPQLVPLIAAANDAAEIDVFGGMGGVADWADEYPDECTLDSTLASCAWWCDEQSCDQCHPNDAGYVQLAKTVMAGLGL